MTRFSKFAPEPRPTIPEGYSAPLDTTSTSVLINRRVAMAMADNTYAGAQRGIQAANVPLAPKAVNPSCFGNIEDVVGVAGSAAQRVEQLVDRLIGSEPKSDDANSTKGAVGLFNVADDHARDIRGSLQRIFRALDRLESQLP